MKYGESVFDILYLLFAIISGCLILRRAGNRTEKYMGLAALILGCGDAFHLIPRVLNYFVDADLTAALGVGKLITSISMTVYYLLLYYIWRGYYRMGGKQEDHISLMDPAVHTDRPVSAPAERLDGKQHRYGLGDDPQCSICSAWCCCLPALCSEEKE